MPPKYPADERKQRAVERIEALGFAITELFLPWSTANTSQLSLELGINTLTHTEGIVTALLRRQHSRSEVIARFRELYPKPKRPTKGPLQQLAKQLKDQPVRIIYTPQPTPRPSASINISHGPQTPISQSPSDDSASSIEIPRGHQGQAEDPTINDDSVFEPADEGQRITSPTNYDTSPTDPGIRTLVLGDSDLGRNQLFLPEGSPSPANRLSSHRSIYSRSSPADQDTALLGGISDDDSAGVLPPYLESPTMINGRPSGIRRVADPKNPKNPTSNSEVNPSVSHDASKRVKHTPADAFLNHRRAKRAKVASSVRKLRFSYDDSVESVVIHEGKMSEAQPSSESTTKDIDSIPDNKIDEIIAQEKAQIADFKQRAEQYVTSQQQRVKHLEQLVKLQRKLKKNEAGLAGLEDLRKRGLLGDSSDEGGDEEESEEVEDTQKEA